MLYNDNNNTELDTEINLLDALLCYNILKTDIIKHFARVKIWEALHNYNRNGGDKFIIYDIDKDKFTMDCGK